MPDYKAMRAEGRAIGRRQGRAEAEIERERQRQQRKLMMEQRFAEMARNKHMQENEIAKSKYAQAQAGKAEEDAFMATAVDNGTMLEDGTYTQKHWELLAKQKFFSQNRNLAEEQHFMQNLKAYADREKSGAKQGYSRKYSASVAETNLRRALEFNAATEKSEASKEFLTGIDRTVDKLFGPRTEAPEKPSLLSQPEGKQFGTNEVLEDSVQYPTSSGSMDIKNPIQVYGKNPDGSVDTSTQRTMFIDGSGRRMEATPEGAIPFDGDYINVKDYGKDSKTTSGVGINALKDDVRPETRNKIVQGNKIIKLTKDIAQLSTVDTSASISKVPAKIASFFGTEWQALKDEQSKQEFVKDKINSALRLEENLPPETASDISAALGKLDSQKLSLAYAIVKLNRESGRFNGQELENQLTLFRDRGLPYILSAVNTAYLNAKESVKTNVKEAAAETAVTRLFIGDGRIERTKSEVLSSFEGDPIEDSDGDWVIRIREEDRAEYGGAKFVVIEQDGGIDFYKE